MLRMDHGVERTGGTPNGLELSRPDALEQASAPLYDSITARSSSQFRPRSGSRALRAGS